MDSHSLNIKRDHQDSLQTKASEHGMEGQTHTHLKLIRKTDLAKENSHQSVARSHSGYARDEGEEEVYSPPSGGSRTALDFYMHAISKYPPLNEQEETLLARRIREQEEQLVNLVIQLMRIVSKERSKKTVKKRFKKIQDTLNSLNNAFNLFASLVKQAKEQRKIKADMRKLAGKSEKTSQNLQEALYALRTEMGKTVAEINLFVGRKKSALIMRDYRKLIFSARVTKKQRIIQRDLSRNLREIDYCSEKIRTLKNQMIQAHLRLVLSMAKKYTHLGLPLADLVQEGNIGLMRAINTYDYERAPRFATYARWWILQSFIRALNSKSMTIRKPFYINEKLCQINKASNRLLQACERKPTLKEIASETDIPLEMVVRVVQSFKDPFSFDDPVEPKRECITNPLQCSAIAPVLEQVISCNLSHTIDSVLSSLPAREREIVKLRFGIGATHDHTLEEIGEKLNLTRERIRQILDVVLMKLRTSKRIAKLKDFVEDN